MSWIWRLGVFKKAFFAFFSRSGVLHVQRHKGATVLWTPGLGSQHPRRLFRVFASAVLVVERHMPGGRC